MRRLFVALPAVFTLAACSTSGPLAPASQSISQPDPFGAVVGLGDMATGSLGAMEVTIDPASLNYEATPLFPREAAGQGDNFHLSIRPFLGPKNLRLTGIQRNGDGNLELTVRLTHPFAAPPDLNGPPSATKRVDLHVFDVNGIAVIDGADTFFNGNVKTNANFLMNADGYRDPGVLFDKTTFGIPTSGANVFPYRLFAAGIDTTQPRTAQGNYDATNNGWQGNALLSPSGFDVFPQGGAAEVMYEVTPPGSGSFNFTLVVTAKYQDPRSTGAGRTKRLPTGNPTDLRYILPEACGDLQRISASVSGTLRDDQSSDIASVAFQILDWDHDATVAATFPNGADLTEVREDSSIIAIDADFPLLNASGPLNGSAVAPVAGNPVLWESGVSVNNTDLYDVAPGGEWVAGLIRVQDSQDLDDGSPTGIKPFILSEASTVPVPGATLSSTRYQVVRVLVEDFNSGPPNLGPPASTTFTFPPSVVVDTPFNIDLDTAVPGLATLDPDGLSLFEVDWDNNGTWDASITATSGDNAPDFTHTYTVENPSQQYKLRITDAYLPAGGRLSTEYGPFTVNVTSAAGPITPTIGPNNPVAPSQLQGTFSYQWDRFMNPMVSDGNGNIYVTYRPGSLTNTIIRSNDGGVTWGAPVDMTGISSSNGGSLAVLANGNVVAAYISTGTSGAGGNLAFMRIVPGAGASVTINPVQTVSAVAEWRDPMIVADPTDTNKAWILANRDTTPSSSVSDQSNDNLHIYAVTNAAGAASFASVSTGLDPASHIGNLNDPHMVMGSGGILHVVWTNANTTAGPDNGLFYRAFDTNTNTPVAAEERVSTSLQTAASMHGFILTDQAGNPVVFYDENAFTTATNDIYVTRRTGTWSTPVAVSQPADVGQTSPYAIRDNLGRFLVVWRDYRTGSANADVYGRFLNADLTFNDVEFAIDNTTDSTLHPRIAYDGTIDRIACTFYNASGAGSLARIQRRVIDY
ncbi:MAG: hypothetical protein GEEBNDBF_01239 [bacterium]|nr:hypothetical protein [bacterium]